MDDEEYTESERRLLERLPTLPPIASIRTSNVWVVEWLPQDELQTGRLLHEWMESSRPRWALHIACACKADVIAAIARAERFVRRTGQVPILHLEAHGDPSGLVGPDGSGGHEWLLWDELTEPLQALNLATGCHLAVVVAACEGFAGISALTRGPRAPAVVLIGPIMRLTGSDLLRAMKELYRRWRDEDPHLRDMLENASRETNGVDFEFEPYATLCYEALTDDMVRRYRRAEPLADAGDLAGAISLLPAAKVMQRLWDQMFMMDIFPDNRSRFGIDMALVLEPFLHALRAKASKATSRSG